MNRRESEDASDGNRDTEDLRALYEAKTRAELQAADASAPGSDTLPSAGALLADVVLVKGVPGPAETSGGAALSGPDGQAADAALDALGYDPCSVFKIVSRVEPSQSPEQRAERLRLVVEATDPDLVVALDEEAAKDVAMAHGIGPLVFGRPVIALGRTFLAVDDLEASLADQARKRRVWRQLKSVTRAAR